MTDIEVWKQITNYDNYEVSTFGNVKNKKTNKIMKLSVKEGYLQVGLVNLIKKKPLKFID